MKKLLLTLLIVSIHSVSLYAQTAQESMSIPIERMRPPSDSNGLLGVEWAGLREKNTLDVAAWFNYTNDPLILTRMNNNQEERVGSLIHHHMGLQLTAAYTILEQLQAGLLLNATLYQDRPDTNVGVATNLPQLQKAGLGDISLFGKYQILHKDKHPIQLTAIGYLSLPTGGSDNYLGDTSITFEPGLIISKDVGHLRLSSNITYIIRKHYEILGQIIDDEIRYGIGAGYDIDHLTGLPVTAYASLQGAFSATSAFTTEKQIPVEILIGGQYRFNKKMYVTVGLGTGLISAFGNPDQRVVATFGYTNQVVEEMPAEVLAPPPPKVEEPPPPPVEPPQPIEPPKPVEEPKPEIPVDSDNDGFIDTEDECPQQAGEKDNNGCPWPDSDGDSVPDQFDNCPNEKGDVENQGCLAKQVVVIKKEAITITEKILFESGSDVIVSRSLPVLDNIATILKDHPEIKLVRIEGHTDNIGSAMINKQISQSRAESVRNYLIERGVDSSRLEAIGYGLERPIAPNSTRSGRATNRRVEFIIPTSK